MAKAKRQLEANLKLADAVLLMLDARAPLLTRHLELEGLLRERNTPFALVLNKTDLAQKEITEHWARHLRAQGFRVLQLSALQGRGPGPLTPLLAELDEELKLRRARRGLLPRPPRLMVAGLPNSGKSTLLNRLVGQTRFKAGKKPGLTRGGQWVVVAGRYQLLDTPGILYPRIEGDAGLAILSALGSIRRDVLPIPQVASWLLTELQNRGRLENILGPQAQNLGATLPLTIEDLAEFWSLAQNSDDGTRQAFERLLVTLGRERLSWELPSA